MVAIEKDLAGDVAIVTGAGINTGSVICQTLAAAGAAVVVNYRNAKAGAEDTVRRIKEAGGKAVAIQGDVTIEADVKRLVRQTVDAFGPPSILVNNANVRSFRPIMELTAKEWRETLASTLDGTFYCVQACVPHMRQLGRGTIVNIGGGSGHSGRPGRAHVAAAKAGLAGMTGSLASELAPDGINVNCIVPGKVDIRPPVPGREPLHVKAPSGRPGEMIEIANLVHFLCGEKCRFMTGQMLHVNGAAYVTIA